MHRLTKPVGIYIALSTIAGLAWVTPVLFYLLGIFTLGLSWLVPTIWLYITALVPGYILGKVSGRTRISAIVSAVCLLAVAFVPAIVAHQAANQEVQELSKDDFRGLIQQKPENITLRVKARTTRSKDKNPLDLAACDALCQRILLSNQISSVTMEAIDKQEHKPIVVAYRLEKLQQCPSIFANASDAIPNTIQSMIDGICIVPHTGIEMKTGLVIEEQIFHNNSIQLDRFWTLSSAKRLLVYNRTDGLDTRILQQTEIETKEAMAPFMLSPYGGFFTTVKGWRTVSKTNMINSYSLPRFFENDLKIPIVDNSIGKDLTGIKGKSDDKLQLRGRPIKPDAVMVKSILDKPGDARFGPEIEDVINEWGSRFRYNKPLPNEDDKRLLIRILDDRRVREFTGIAWMLWGRPELVDPLTSHILARFSPGEPELGYGGALDLAKLVARRASNKELTLQKSRLFAVLYSGVSYTTAPLLIAAARLGIEVKNILQIELKLKRTGIYRYALQATCVASSDLYQLVEPILDSELKTETDYQNIRQIALTLLVKNGMAEVEIRQFNASTINRERLISSLSKLPSDAGTANCFR